MLVKDLQKLCFMHLHSFSLSCHTWLQSTHLPSARHCVLGNSVGEETDMGGICIRQTLVSVFHQSGRHLANSENFTMVISIVPTAMLISDPEITWNLQHHQLSRSHSAIDRRKRKWSTSREYHLIPAGTLGWKETRHSPPLPVTHTHMLKL